MSRTGIIHNPHVPLKGLTLRANLRPFRKDCATVGQEDFKVTDRRHRGESSSDASSSRVNVPVDHRSESPGSDIGQADLGSLFMVHSQDEAQRGKSEALVRAATSQLSPVDLF